MFRARAGLVKWMDFTVIWTGRALVHLRVRLINQLKMHAINILWLYSEMPRDDE
jgi:hypothetical protein